MYFFAIQPQLRSASNRYYKQTTLKTIATTVTTATTPLKRELKGSFLPCIHTHSNKSNRPLTGESTNRRQQQEQVLFEFAPKFAPNKRKPQYDEHKKNTFFPVYERKRMITKPPPDRRRTKDYGYGNTFYLCSPFGGAERN